MSALHPVSESAASGNALVGNLYAVPGPGFNGRGERDFQGLIICLGVGGDLLTMINNGIDLHIVRQVKSKMIERFQGINICGHRSPDVIDGRIDGPFHALVVDVEISPRLPGLQG